MLKWGCSVLYEELNGCGEAVVVIDREDNNNEDSDSFGNSVFDSHGSPDFFDLSVILGAEQLPEEFLSEGIRIDRTGGPAEFKFCTVV
jgi:hypothetical protein